MLNTFLVTGQCPSSFCGRRAKRFRYIRVPQPLPWALHCCLCLSVFLPPRPLALPQPLPSVWAIWMETSPCVPFDLLQAILCVAKCAAAASTPVCFARSSPLMACCCCVGIWGMKLKERKKVLLCESGAKEWWKNAIFYMKIFFERTAAVEWSIRTGSERVKERHWHYHHDRRRIWGNLRACCLPACLLACPRSVGCHLIILSSSSSGGSIDDDHAPRWPSASTWLWVWASSSSPGQASRCENCGNKNRIQCRFFPQLRYRRRSRCCWWCLRFSMTLLSGHQHPRLRDHRILMHVCSFCSYCPRFRTSLSLFLPSNNQIVFLFAKL